MGTIVTYREVQLRTFLDLLNNIIVNFRSTDLRTENRVQVFPIAKQNLIGVSINATLFTLW
jgi:hypothetical protein